MKSSRNWKDKVPEVLKLHNAGWREMAISRFAGVPRDRVREIIRDATGGKKNRADSLPGRSVNANANLNAASDDYRSHVDTHGAFSRDPDLDDPFSERNLRSADPETFTIPKDWHV